LSALPADLEAEVAVGDSLLAAGRHAGVQMVVVIRQIS
jgi:hypothetical protein